MTTTEYTVGAVAKLAGISVRTLHHYDEIGLLEPSEHNSAGYRIYTDDDLRKLQRILFYRELGFELHTVRSTLLDPETGDEQELRRQRQLLTDQIARHQAMVATIDKELRARRLGITLTPEERLEVFGSTALEDNADRAEDRWGDTDSWQQRRQRAATHSKEDWIAIRLEQSDIHQRLLDAMRSGIPATDDVAMDLAEEQRRHLERWFHDCGHDAHRELAAAYLANQRIGLNFDDVADGLSRYVHDAILANADRAATRPAR